MILFLKGSRSTPQGFPFSGSKQTEIRHSFSSVAVPRRVFHFQEVNIRCIHVLGRQSQYPAGFSIFRKKRSFRKFESTIVAVPRRVFHFQEDWFEIRRGLGKPSQYPAGFSIFRKNPDKAVKVKLESRSTPQGFPFSGRNLFNYVIEIKFQSQYPAGFSIFRKGKIMSKAEKRNGRSTPQGFPFSGSYANGTGAFQESSQYPAGFSIFRKQQALEESIAKDVAVPRRVFHFQEATKNRR